MERKTYKNNSRYLIMFFNYNRHHWWLGSDASIFTGEYVLRAKNIEKPCSIFFVRKLVGFLSGYITFEKSALMVLDRYYSIFRPYSYDARKDRTGTATSVVLSSWFVTTAICTISIITTNYNLAIIPGGALLFSFAFVSVWVHHNHSFKADSTRNRN